MQACHGLDGSFCRCYPSGFHQTSLRPPCHAVSERGVSTRVEFFREFLLVKLTLRDRESAQEAVRRFRKLVERSGVKKEIRIREFYEKPSETKRRARLRAQRRGRRDRMMTR